MLKESEIYVVTSDSDEDMRSGGLLAIDSSVIKTELTRICSVLDHAFKDITTTTATYDLSEVSVKVEVTASGKLALLGSGISASGVGGITLKFTKKLT